MDGPVEITDLLWAGDGVPIRRDAVVARLETAGQRRAARLAARLPVAGERWYSTVTGSR